MTIEPRNNETQTRWDRGEFQVMIMSPQSSQPMGFCNGEKADEDEIREQALMEGAEIAIDKKLLKTGREIWTVRPIESF